MRGAYRLGAGIRDLMGDGNAVSFQVVGLFRQKMEYKRPDLFLDIGRMGTFVNCSCVWDTTFV